jgi:hypothetical protein
MALHVIRPEWFGLGDVGTLEPTWEAAKRALDGATIQMLPLRDGRVLLMDDDGKMKQLPRNEYATTLARADGGLPFHDHLVGNVLMVEPADVESVLG